MTSNTITRLARSADLDSLAALAVRSFRDTFGVENDERDMEDYLSSSMTVEKINEDFADAKNVFLVACSSDHDQLLGYAKLRNPSKHVSVVGDQQVEIERIYADSSVIGKGVGAALMTECLSQARSFDGDTIWLGVWEENQRAIRFYERWGFAIVGEQKFKLGADIQNDLIMRKSLCQDEA